MQLENIYHWYTASGALVVELPPETDLQILVKGLSSLGGLVCFDSSSAAADGFSYAADAEQPNGACLSCPLAMSWAMLNQYEKSYGK